MVGFANAESDAADLMSTPASLFARDRWEKRFLFIADSQTLADVLCGKSALADETKIPIMERITQGMLSVYKIGW